MAHSWQSILALGLGTGAVPRPYFRDYFKTLELVGSVPERLRLDSDYLDVDVISTECASLLREASHLPFR